MVDFSPNDQDVPETTLAKDRKKVYDVSEEYRNTARAFKRQRAIEINDDFPYRKSNNRYLAVQECLKTRLNGGKFNYEVYLSCAGCTSCDTVKNERKPKKNKQKQEKTSKNILISEKKEQKSEKIEQDSEERIEEKTQRNIQKSERNKLKSDSEFRRKYVEELQKIETTTNEIESWAVDGNSITFPKEKKLAQILEKMLKESRSVSKVKKGADETKLFKMQLKAMSILNRDNDIYN